MLLQAGCTAPPEVRFFAPDAYPEKLSAWGLIAKAPSSVAIGEGSRVYHINMELFSDYALKLRTMYLPPGTGADFHPTDAFDFPVGTVFTKTFFYERAANDAIAIDARWSGELQDIDPARHAIIETRLLVRQDHGWDALPYIWDGDDAVLALTGDLRMLDVAGRDKPLPYLVPSRNQCASCHATNHTTGALQPIGLKARHLNLERYGENQLARMAADGLINNLPTVNAIPAAPGFDDETSTVALARSYLDINCGHCHNAQGPADTSGLLLDIGAHPPRAMGVCKPPIAAGRGSGGRLYSIVPGQPDASILAFRMETTDPAAAMPELGRALVHRQGVQLIRRWIASLQGVCR